MADQRPPAAPSIVVGALRPQIIVYSSPDVDDIARRNGLDSLVHLLKPWEGSVERVTLRTSTFISHVASSFPLLLEDWRTWGNAEMDVKFLDKLSTSLEKRVDGWLETMTPLDLGADGDPSLWQEGSIDELTPWYAFYRNMLLEQRGSTAYETFGHPVACIIAVSTANLEPLNAFAGLYEQTSPENLFGSKTYMDPTILRYYVLVHDLTTGPADEWTPLLDDIRKVYGLHCNFLCLNAEAATRPDSSYASPSERPLPKTVDFARQWATPVLAESDSGVRVGTDDVNQATPVEPGHLLGEEDVRQIKLFLREFVVQSLVPYMERNVTQWNEQLAASRKGIAGRLFSVGRKYFGSRPASPAANHQNTPSYDAVAGLYPYQSQEGQTRRLADFAFIVCDYRLAASTYEICRKDFLNDKAWKHYASATRMAGLTHLLISLGTSAALFDADAYLEAAAAATPGTSIPLDELRATALAYELYQMKEDWSFASMSLERAARDIEEIPSALMLEQAALAYLKRSSPARRKSALTSLLAAHRYQRSAFRSLARRCGMQSLSLFGQGPEIPWRSVRAHINATLGQMSYNQSDGKSAVKHFLSLIPWAEEIDLQGVREDDSSVMDNFRLAWAVSTHDRLYIEAMDTAKNRIIEQLLDPTNKDQAYEDDLQLPHRLVDHSTISLAPSRSGVQAAVRTNDVGWQALEAAFLNNDDSSLESSPLSAGSATFKIAVGEVINVHFTLQNPLNATLTIADIRAVFDNEAGACSSIPLSAVDIPPLERRQLSIQAKAEKAGKCKLVALAYRFAGLLECHETVSRLGKRLYATKAQLLTPSYENDISLSIDIDDPSPLLAIDMQNLPAEMLQGEIRRGEIHFCNIGSKSMRNLRATCDARDCVFLDNEGRENVGYNAAGLGVMIDNRIQTHVPFDVPLPQGLLAPEGRITLPCRLIANATDSGSLLCRWVFNYEDEVGRHFTSHALHSITVLPALSVSMCLDRSLAPLSSALRLTVRNMADTRLHVAGVFSASLAWRIQRLSAIGATPLLTNQTGIVTAEVCRETTFPSRYDVYRHTLQQLEALHLDRDTPSVSSDSLRLHTSALEKTDCGDLPPDYAVWLASKRQSRLKTLGAQLPTDQLARVSEMFPLFLPEELDVWILWSAADSDHRGWLHAGTLQPGNRCNVVDGLVRQLSQFKSKGQEGERERRHLVDALLRSELAAFDCPIAVTQDSGSDTARSNCVRTSRLRLQNLASEDVQCTLELLSERLPHQTSQPARWIGRQRRKQTVEACGNNEISLRYVLEAESCNAGAWRLSVEHEGRQWIVDGVPRLVTA